MEATQQRRLADTVQEDLQKTPLWGDEYVCPRCHGDLLFTGKAYQCRLCMAIYSVKSTTLRNRQPDFRPDHLQQSPFHLSPPSPTDEAPSWQNQLKASLRQNPSLYRLLTRTLKPLLILGPSAQDFVNQLGPQKRVLDLGSGNRRLQGNVTHLDYEPYPHLEVVGDANFLPFPSNRFDAVVCKAVLGHVPEPERVIAEIHRVLRPGGQVFMMTPFMYGFHDGPNDFNRLTHRGLQSRMAEGFEQEVLQVISGPTSALNGLLVEWLALFCSLGIHQAYPALRWFFMVLLSPLKVMDFILCQHPEAIRVAAVILFIGKKRIPPSENA